ncbi:transmembrane protein 107-like [Cloeon dipterum]|uniref:transmembrane protein 107-like n=1 Tax=Cloeon dipterum TaxID=197152 RepID=UPI0032209F79
MTILADGGLIPTRFLTLLAHLVVLIILIWSREENVHACMPLEYSIEDFKTKDTRLLIGLCTAVALIVVELFGFLSGLSMFITSVSAVSSFCHGLGSILLSMAVVDSWDCNMFWWVFAATSITPAIVEIIATCMLVILHNA